MTPTIKAAAGYAYNELCYAIRLRDAFAHSVDTASHLAPRVVHVDRGVLRDLAPLVPSIRAALDGAGGPEHLALRLFRSIAARAHLVVDRLHVAAPHLDVRGVSRPGADIGAAFREVMAEIATLTADIRDEAYSETEDA